MSDRPFVHTPHKHTPRNINRVHKAERVGLNQRIAILITKALGSVPCMYLFVILAIIGFPGFTATPQQYVQWVSQTFIQLVALSVLGIAQNVLSRHQELQSEESFETTKKIYADSETIISQNNELIAQNNEIIKQQTAINEKLDKLAIIEAQSNDIFAQNDRILEHVQKPKPTASKVKAVRVVRSEEAGE